MSQDTPDARDDFLRERRKDIEERLTGQGTFLVPDNTTSAILLNAYFTWFHPCYPILDRAATYESYANQTVPQLLRQAMCFIGISLCTDEEFVKTGFEDRYRTKFLFYSRAKAIFDAELESNVIVKLQSLFLLSFWRGRPSEERDTRFWLGIAIDIAQKRGVHVLYIPSSRATVRADRTGRSCHAMIRMSGRYSR